VASAVRCDEDLIPLEAAPTARHHQENQRAPTYGTPGVRVCQRLRFIAMRRTFFASGDFGTVMVSTPFLIAAIALSSSTSCIGIRLSKRP
jgi:hypothetical protein